MILSRELGKRIWGGSTNMENGGGVVSSDAIAGLLTGYAKESWVDEHYISIDFFSRLFQAHGTENGSEIDVMPNDMETTITSVESMFGFWTNLYISALGSNGAAPAGISLGMLTDVVISGTPSAGQVLTFDAVSGKWINGNGGASSLAGLTDVALTSLENGQTLLYDSTTSKWYNSHLKTINGQSILGYGDISVGGGSGGSNYLVLTTGKTTFNFWDTVNTAVLYKMQNVSNGAPSGYPYGYLFNFAWQGPNSWSGQLYNTVSDFGSELFTRGYRADTNAWTPWKKFWGNTPDGTGVITTTNWNAIRTEFSGSSVDYWGLYVKKPDMTSGQRLRIGFGREETTNNNANIAYEYAGYGSNMNYISFNHYGADRLLKIYANGNIAFGMISTDPTQKYEFVGGSVYIHSDSDSQQDLIVGKIRGYSFGGRDDEFLQLYQRVNIGEPRGWGYLDVPTFGLGVYGGCFLAYSQGDVGIGTTSPSYKLHVAGTIYATGAITALSDARKKDITGEADVTVEQIAHAPAVQFLWKDKERRKDGQQVGTLAQYWKAVLPEVVSDKGGELSMQYGVAALVSAIVTARKVVDHERRITELEKENERLRTEVEQLRLN